MGNKWVGGARVTIKSDPSFFFFNFDWDITAKV